MRRIKCLRSRRSSMSLDSNWRSGISDENKKKNCAAKINDISDEFLRYTSIHGMRYIGERQRPIFERAIWTLIVLAGCTFSIYGCYLEWNKWNSCAILVTRDTAIVNHDSLIFPVVTICSTNKISKKKLQILFNDPKYSETNLTMIVKVIGYLTRFNSLLEPDNDFPLIVDSLAMQNISMEDLVYIVQKVTPSCKDILLDCKWQSNVVDCFEIISSRLTDNGVCCSIEIDSLEHSKKFLNLVNDTTPEIVDEFGVNSALRIILDTTPNDTAGNVTPFDGFRVLLHNRGEFADVTNRGFPIASGHDNFVSINSISVHYKSGIPKVPFEKRKCYVDGERRLKFHSSFNYSRSICLHECRLEKIIDQCHCVPYFYEASNIAVPNCSLKAYTCVAKYFGGYHQALISSYCNCPEICNTHWFTADITSVPFSPRGFPQTKSSKRIHHNKDIDPSDSPRFVGLRIFFKHNAGDSFTMDLPFDTKELFASMGGLLGFGLGFSIISGVELLYFFCCRMCFRKKRELIQNRDEYNWPKTGVDFPFQKSRSSKTIRATIPFTGRTIAWVDPAS